MKWRKYKAKLRVKSGVGKNRIRIKRRLQKKENALYVDDLLCDGFVTGIYNYPRLAKAVCRVRIPIADFKSIVDYLILQRPNDATSWTPPIIDKLMDILFDYIVNDGSSIDLREFLHHLTEDEFQVILTLIEMELSKYADMIGAVLDRLKEWGEPTLSYRVSRGNLVVGIVNAIPKTNYYKVISDLVAKDIEANNFIPYAILRLIGRI